MKDRYAIVNDYRRVGLLRSREGRASGQNESKTQRCKPILSAGKPNGKQAAGREALRAGQS
ncbi:MAG TPA: hypothetical protein VFS47_05935 [Steroidobacteraceae bacterium]|nr:hypothetical protein [Steroidobacteraceae bacterium]